MTIDRTSTRYWLLCSTLLVAACELPFDQQAKIDAKRQAEAMATGSGCRYSSRLIEQCYAMNPKMSKAAILQGWREMDAYMRDNNIVVAVPEGGLDLPNLPKKTEATGEPNAANGEAGAPAAETPAAGSETPKAAEATPPGAPAPKRTQSPQGMAEERKPLKHMV